MKKKLVTILFLLSLTITCFGQSTLKKKELFFGMGSARYKGDLGRSYGAGSLLFSMGIKLNTERRLHGNINLSIGSATGNELDYTFEGDQNATPNTSFSTSFIGLNYEAHFNIVNREKLKVYLSQGVGFARYQPKDEFDNKLIDQTETRALGESYGNITFMLPTQIGIKYITPINYAVGFQIGFLNTITDYLDNIGQWGNDSGNDNILTTRFTIYVPVDF